MRISYRKMLFVAMTSSLCCGLAQAQDPVQVFILAGQSNMEGKGSVENGTNGVLGAIGGLRYQVNNDPANYGHLGDGEGNWNTRTDVHVYSTTDGGEGGGLTVGYGSSAFIGPELGFGSVIGDAYTEDVLIIKTSWGGKSLGFDFRPPSAVQDRGGFVGEYYDLILSEVSTVLSNIGTHVPGYSGQGYELKGFGWHQGWNDRVSEPFVAEYEANMADFINDIRFDLGAADLPFVIANTGIGGLGETNTRALDLMDAQLAMADPVKYPQFDGNVKAINTQSFWRDASVSPVTSGNQGFHWNQNGETFYLIGDAMGDEMATMSSYVQFERAYITVDQQSGEIRIVNPGSNPEDLDLEAYQITSASGALSAANWASIAGNYDGAGDESVDSGDWSVVTSTTGELGEAAVPGGPDGLIAAGNEVSLGAGAWIQNLTKDLQATYTDTDGNVIDLYIRYLGDDNIRADLNTDGSITAADWLIFADSIQLDMSSLSAAQAYQLGDLDGDLDNDIDDFDLFRRAYELDHPAPGAFAAMVAQASVPEPSALFLLAVGAAGLCRRRRRNVCAHGPSASPGLDRTAQHGKTFAMRGKPNMTYIRTGILAGAIAIAIACGSANADLLVYEPFNYSVGALAGQAGGTGMSGAWADGPDGAGTAGVWDESTAGTPVSYSAAGGDLSWDGFVNNVPTTPVSPDARYVGLSQPTGSGDKFEAYRPLAQSAGDMAGGDGVLWMSAVWHFQGQSYGAHVGLALSTDSFTDRSTKINTSGSFGSGDGDAIGVGRFAGPNGNADWNNLSPAIYDGGTAAAFTTGNSLPNGDSIVILKFQFVDGAALDTVTAYSFSESAMLSEATFNTNAVSASFAIDQGTLNILTFDQNRGENAVDEIRIGDTFDDVVTGVILPPPLTLQVDMVTGSVTMLGDDDESITTNYYEITSAGNSLDPAGWLSLTDQDFEGNGPANGSGNGWEEGGGSGSHALAEGYLLGDSTIAAGEEISLGTAYNTAVDAQDLVFRYRIETGQRFEGIVEYLTSALPGDANANGFVDDTDLAILLGNWEQDELIISTWALGNFTESSLGDTDVDDNDLAVLLGNWTGPPPPGGAAVPEPATLALLGLGGLAVMRRRRR